MNRIAELRKKRNLTQKEFGIIMGVAQNTVCNWETGKREPDYESLKKMAFFFNCSTDYLLGSTPFGLNFVFDEKIDQKSGWSGHPKIESSGKEKPTPEDEGGLSDKDTRLIDWFHSLPPEKRKAILMLGEAPEGLDE